MGHAMLRAQPLREGVKSGKFHKKVRRKRETAGQESIERKRAGGNRDRSFKVAREEFGPEVEKNKRIIYGAESGEREGLGLQVREGREKKAHPNEPMALKESQ